MANLVIDAGNTGIKVAVFNNRKIEFLESFGTLDLAVLSQISIEKSIRHAILSTVRNDLDEVERFLEEKFLYIRFNYDSAVMIKNHYKSKSTLGLDRLAAIVGAKAVFPNDNCLVIDSGTCITYDFVDSRANYYGGSISPGISMRFKALHAFTHKLPLLEKDQNYTDNFGRDTATAIISGVENGAFYEAEGFIKRYHSNCSNLKIVLCGGDYRFFDTRLKNSIFAPAVTTEPALVLIGLNEIIHRHTND